MGAVTAKSLEAKAEQADQVADELEAQAEAGADIQLGDIEAHRAEARALRFRARTARARTEAEARRQRLEQLAQLHDQVIAEAKTATTEPVEAAIGRLRAAYEVLRQTVDRHNRRMRDLQQQARVMQVQERAPSGPRQTSGGIALTPGGIQAGETELRPLPDARELAGAVIASQPATVPAVVVARPAPAKPRHLVLGRGQLVTAVHEISENVRTLISTGDLILLSDGERDAWWDGELDLSQIDQDARRAEQLAAAEAAEQARWEQLHARQRAAMERNEQAARDRAAARR